ncbi:MAG TPA: phage holin family protein [Candidatus Fournierella merdavium]|nr:phage holin family protein [Candidatus Fournierella merdavium]
MDNSNIFLAVKAAIVGVFGAFGAAFGWLGWLVLAWVACMAVDWLSGSSAAMQAGQWSSARARGGIWHKAGMIVVVIVAALADAVLGMVAAKVPGLPIDYTVLLLPVVLVWYILTELGSILENAAAMGAPVPEFLVNILAAAREKVEVATGDTGEETE